jgi:hypothetical protein
MSYGLRIQAGGKKPIELSQVSYGTCIFFDKPKKTEPFNARLFCEFDWTGFDSSTVSVAMHNGADRLSWPGNILIVSNGLYLENPIDYSLDPNENYPIGGVHFRVLVTALPSSTGDAYGLRIANPRNVNPILLPNRCVQVLQYAAYIPNQIGDFDIPGIQDRDIVFVGATIPGNEFSCIRGMSRYDGNHLHFVGNTAGVRILTFRNVGAASQGGYGLRIRNPSGTISISDKQPPILITNTFNSYAQTLPGKLAFTPVITSTAGWYSGNRWRKATNAIFSKTDGSYTGFWEANHWQEDSVYADGYFQCKSSVLCVDMDMYPEHFGGG